MKRFLLLSDIHATDIDPSRWDAPSTVSSSPVKAGNHVEPIADLEAMLRREGREVDYVLCAGDITNKAHPASLTFAWEKLNALSSALGAKLIATVGNHDLDSRYKENAFDPKGYAMALSPQLPTDERSAYLEFWAENFTLINEDNCNVVVLNTAAYHGGGKDIAIEIEHGRISEMTLNLLSGRLTSAPHAAINVLLCHHHPIKGDQGDNFTIGPTRGGERLLEILDETDRPWIVVHGHKHIPELFYGSGGGNSPVVLACASFSAQVNADAQNKNPNQVHLLTCDPKAAAAASLDVAGTVESWTWVAGVGWKPAKPDQGLPYKAGFGYRASPSQIVNELEAHLATFPEGRMRWTDALAKAPAISNLIPRDFERFKKKLAERDLIILNDSNTNQPLELGKLNV